MLTIRMQRKGRSGHAQFRVIVQDSRFHPSSGRVVAYVGNYDPHSKKASLDGEKISTYLSKGAQPSDRIAKLLQKEGIKLPEWFKPAAPKTGKVRNPDKRRSTRPAGTAEPDLSAEASAKEEPKAEVPTEGEIPAEKAPEDVPAEQIETSIENAEAPAEAKTEIEEPASEVLAESAAEDKKAE